MLGIQHSVPVGRRHDLLVGPIGAHDADGGLIFSIDGNDRAGAVDLIHQTLIIHTVRVLHHRIGAVQRLIGKHAVPGAEDLAGGDGIVGVHAFEPDVVDDRFAAGKSGLIGDVIPFLLKRGEDIPQTAADQLFGRPILFRSEPVVHIEAIGVHLVGLRVDFYFVHGKGDGEIVVYPEK